MAARRRYGNWLDSIRGATKRLFCCATVADSLRRPRIQIRAGYNPGEKDLQPSQSTPSHVGHSNRQSRFRRCRAVLGMSIPGRCLDMCETLFEPGVAQARRLRAAGVKRTHPGTGGLHWQDICPTPLTLSDRRARLKFPAAGTRRWRDGGWLMTDRLYSESE